MLSLKLSILCSLSRLAPLSHAVKLSSSLFLNVLLRTEMNKMKGLAAQSLLALSLLASVLLRCMALLWLPLGIGMLSTIATGLAVDAYGPISDNAGGITEMVGIRHRIRERTDALDAAGNTTAAIGKGFASDLLR